MLHCVLFHRLRGGEKRDLTITRGWRLVIERI